MFMCRMKKQKKIKLLYLFVFLILPISGYTGQFVDGSKKILEIETKYFKIVFPEDSLNTALTLLTYADSEYERLSKIFGVKYNEKFTLLITPDEESVNGFFTSMPYNLIVLYDYLNDPSILPFDNYFYNLFIHELTHALTLNLRNGFWQFFRNIFGSYISPHYWQMPFWMIEGVSVSIESMDGDGRNNSPIYRAILSQHLLEEKFQTAGQVSHIRPYPKKSDLHYIYGGLFNSYIQKKYGLEKYRTLWMNNNKLVLPYTFYFSFSQIYGNSITLEWEEFSKEFQLKDFILPEVKVLSRGYIKKQALMNSSLFYLDSQEKKIYELNIQNNKKKLIIDGCVDFFLDKKRKLIYSATYEVYSQTRKYVIKNFDLINKKWRPEKFYKVGKLAFYDEAILATKIDKHTTHLILITNNTEDYLIKGDETTFFDQPGFLSDGRMVFLYIESNRRSIAIINETNKVNLIILSNIWIDSIFPVENKLIFTYFLKNSPSLSRIGIIDFEEKKILLQSRDVYGGIYFPIEYGNDLIYIRRLSEIDEIVLLKDYKDTLNFLSLPLLITDLIIPENQKSSPPLVATNIKSFNPLPYLFPAFWLPTYDPRPGLSKKERNFLGFYTASQDPLSENTFELYLDFNDNPLSTNSTKRYGFSWVNSSFPWNLSLSINGENSTFSNNTSISLYTFRNWYFLSEKLRIQLYTGLETGLKNSFDFSIIGGSGYYYNQLYRMPHLPYEFRTILATRYDIYDGNPSAKIGISYNAKVLYISIEGGYSLKEKYTIGKNIDFWGNFGKFYDEKKLSSYFLTTEEGLFLRLDLDCGIPVVPAILPVFLNYLGLNCGSRTLLTEMDFFNDIYIRIYFGTILCYAIPFNPFFEINYLIEKDAYSTLTGLDLTF